VKQQPRFSRWGARPEDDPASKLTTRASLEPPFSAQLKASKPAVAEVQVRTFKNSAVAVQRRGGIQSAGMVRGLAVPYGEVIDLGLGQNELLRYGCFAASLSTDDPRVLYSGNIEKIIGRVAAGTARFNEQRDGLHFEADLPETSWASDLAVSMNRGDVDGTSCVFIIEKCEDQTINDQRVRVITKARLFAASVTAFSLLQGANQATSELIANARVSGFELGLAQGKRAAKAAQGALRNRQARAQSNAVGMLTPTDRTRAEFHRRLNSVR
jgi:uncharacterized protein